MIRLTRNPRLLIGLERAEKYGTTATIEYGRYSYIVPWIFSAHGDERGITRLVSFDGEDFSVIDARVR